MTTNLATAAQSINWQQVRWCCATLAIGAAICFVEILLLNAQRSPQFDRVEPPLLTIGEPRVELKPEPTVAPPISFDQVNDLVELETEPAPEPTPDEHLNEEIVVERPFAPQPRFTPRWRRNGLRN